MNDDFKKLPCDKKWVKYFEKTNAPNFLKIIEYVFAIPHSNAEAERIFSMMKTCWRKERNRLLISNLEAELMIKENYNMSCSEFHDFLKQNVSILEMAKSASKYK